MKQSARLLPLLAVLVVLLAGTLQASTPSSTVINTPADGSPGTKNNVTYTGGPIAQGLVGDVIVGNTASLTCKRANPPTACDWFDLYVNVPSSYYASHIGL